MPHEPRVEVGAAIAGLKAIGIAVTRLEAARTATIKNCWVQVATTILATTSNEEAARAGFATDWDIVVDAAIAAAFDCLVALAACARRRKMF